MALRRWFFRVLILGIVLLLIAGLLGAFVVNMSYNKLPPLDKVTHYQPKIPLRVYSAEGLLISEFGEEKRDFIKIEEVPEVMKQAILAAEDDQFYQHGGVDYKGVMRAAYANFISGGVRQGASTITMQVARNFFLNHERTYKRKFLEVLLTFKIEEQLSKDKILELYMNKIYLGHRSYGFAAAAKTYFGKPLAQVNVAEAAVLAGLPKAPSANNPISNLEKAKSRQRYVLKRMVDLDFISEADYQAARQYKLPVQRRQVVVEPEDKQKPNNRIRANYVAEMVRQMMVEKYGKEQAYSAGFRVYTTIRRKDQNAAYQALRQGVLTYDQRHGYRGPEDQLQLTDTGEAALKKLVAPYPVSDDLLPAVVLSASPARVTAYVKDAGQHQITGEGLDFVSKALTGRLSSENQIRPGSVIRVKMTGNGWQILQLPEVESAFVAADPRTGEIRALVGGFDFFLNKFNHVTQAWRQPGSNIKPFVYSAALEKGFTPATIINDAPLIYDAEETGSKAWTPDNYGHKFDGPISMRRALAKSKNLVTIRIIQAITPEYVQDHLQQFGFDKERHPPYLTTALGAGEVTPMQLLQGYSVFANGGYRVEPYFVQRIERGEERVDVLSESQPLIAGNNAPQVLDVRNAYTMVNLLQEVVMAGTATRARRELQRDDLAGKTGTTNDAKDAWFSGFHPTLVGVAWVGFDQPRSLGNRETGGRTALPIWIDYMKVALADEPPASYNMPPGMVQKWVGEGEEARLEIFYEENVPADPAPVDPVMEMQLPQEEVQNQLY